MGDEDKTAENSNESTEHQINVTVNKSENTDSSEQDKVQDEVSSEPASDSNEPSIEEDTSSANPVDSSLDPTSPEPDRPLKGEQESPVPQPDQPKHHESKLPKNAFAMGFAVVVAGLLIGLGYFTMVSENNTEQPEPASNQTETVTENVDGPRVDQEATEVDTMINQLDENTDFSEDELSDTNLGL